MRGGLADYCLAVSDFGIAIALPGPVAIAAAGVAEPVGSCLAAASAQSVVTDANSGLAGAGPAGSVVADVHYDLVACGAHSGLAEAGARCDLVLADVFDLFYLDPAVDLACVLLARLQACSFLSMPP